MSSTSVTATSAISSSGTSSTTSSSSTVIKATKKQQKKIVSTDVGGDESDDDAEAAVNEDDSAVPDINNINNNNNSDSDDIQTNSISHVSLNLNLADDGNAPANAEGGDIEDDDDYGDEGGGEIGHRQNRTQKFLESADDQLIKQIFSQTITSAGVTPTDDDDDEDSQTTAPFIACLNRLGADTNTLKNQQHPSIVIDCYDDDEAGVEYNTDPVVDDDDIYSSKFGGTNHYFDQTIIDEDDVNEDEGVEADQSIIASSYDPQDAVSDEHVSPVDDIQAINEESVSIAEDSPTEDKQLAEGAEEATDAGVQSVGAVETGGAGDDDGIEEKSECIENENVEMDSEKLDDTVVSSSAEEDRDDDVPTIIETDVITNTNTINTDNDMLCITASTATTAVVETEEVITTTTSSISGSATGTSAIQKNDTAMLENGQTVTTSSSTVANMESEELNDNDNKTLKKKKSDSLTNGKKKMKKNKKSDSTEKENISVLTEIVKFNELIENINNKNHNHNKPFTNGLGPPPATIDENLKRIDVKTLRDSYYNLIGLNDKKYVTHSHRHHHQLNGIKQFDMGTTEDNKNCHSCQKIVFQMEQIKAERNIWHKNCFRCTECNKQLTVDTYQSHESILYCKPHFKALFSPKAVEDNEPAKPKKVEMIIRENQPIELPPDVVRASDKPDLGLDELHQLDVKSRFQVFENAGATETTTNTLERSQSGVKRSASILSKLARFQGRSGNDIGIADDSLNGVPYDQSSSEEEDDEEGGDEDIELVRAKRAQKERPMSFANMNDIKTRFESGHALTKEERREERKQEIQNIRSRLFMGKQAKIKEMYQQAVLDSEQSITSSSKRVDDCDVVDKARSLAEKFEKGEVYKKASNIEGEEDDEMSVFEQGICKKSRSIFLELDATSSKQNGSGPLPTPANNSLSRSQSRVADARKLVQSLSRDDIVKCDTKIEDVQIKTADISSKFKFFETYKPTEVEKKEFRITPPRDGVVKDDSAQENGKNVYQDPNIIRSEEFDDTIIAEKSHTASKMLSKFRQMEEQKEEQFEGMKPLKRFTPPPDDNHRIYSNQSESEYSDEDEEDDEDEEENSEENEEDENDRIIKYEDEFLKAAQSAARAKQLREKFEKWEKNEIKREQNSSSINLYDNMDKEDESQIESAKSLRARFEMIHESSNLTHNERIKVNRFV